MRRSARILTCGALASFALVVTGGCTGPATSSAPAPAVTAAPKPRPTATSAPPEPVPTPTVERSRDTAKEFVVEYFAAFEDGLRRGVPAPIEGLSTAECSKCVGFVDALEELRAESKRWPQAEVRVLPYISEAEDENSATIKWVIDFRSNLGDQIDGAGEVIDSDTGGRYTLYAEVRHADGQWLMNGMSVEGLDD